MNYVSDVVIGFSMLPVLGILIALRVPVGIALGCVGSIGLFFLYGADTVLVTLGDTAYNFVASWELTAIPTFLMMGSIAYHTELAKDLFALARKLLWRLPGGLAIATNLACAGFAAASGSSVAMTGAMAKIAIPEMIDAGYDKGLASGSVASAGTLGALIPPSVSFILFGIFTESSIAKLLLAGIIPGILTMIGYVTLIYIRVKINPSLAPRHNENTTRQELIKLGLRAWPIPAVIAGVIGGLYSGFFTATETGVFGVVLMLVAALFMRRLSLRRFQTIVIEAMSVTGAIFLISLGAIIFTRLIVLTGVPIAIGEWTELVNLNYFWFVMIISIVYLIGGMFLDPIGLMLITLPLFSPMIEVLGLSIIWFGVMVVKYTEIGLLTPPVGLNLFVTSASIGDKVDLVEIIKGTSWFLISEIFIMIFLIIFPILSTWLPGKMG